MKNRKASISSPIPMLVAVLIIFLMGTAVITISQGLSGEVEASYDDLSRVVETKTTTNSYVFNYVVQGAEYSVNQKAQDLGSQSGGVVWSSDNLELMATMQIVFHSRVNRYLANNYAENPDLGRCGVQNPEFNVLLPPPNELSSSDSISSVVTSNASEMRVVCNLAGAEIVQEVNEVFFDAPYEGSYNRYFQLANEALNFFRDLRSNWDNVDTSYTGTNLACQDPEPEPARQEAISNARSALQSGLDSTVSSYPQLGDVSMDAEVSDLEYEIEVENTENGECNCNNGECDTQYESTANLNLQSGFADLTIQDERYNILISSGWSNLVFEVNSYEHKFDSSTTSPSVTVSELEGVSGQSAQVYEDLIQAGMISGSAEQYVSSTNQIFEGLKSSANPSTTPGSGPSDTSPDSDSSRSVSTSPGSTPESESPACNLMYGNGPKSEKYDILFIPNDYSSNSRFRDHIKAFLKYETSIFEPGGSNPGLFQMPPMSSNKEEFNVWYMDTDNSIPDPDGDDIGPVVEGTESEAAKCPFSDSNIMLHPEEWERQPSFAFPGTGDMYIEEANAAGTKEGNQVFLHEWGHSFGDLKDEYYFETRAGYEEQYSGSDNWDRSGRPNCADTLQEAQEWWGDMAEEHADIDYYRGCAYHPDNIRPRESSLMGGQDNSAMTYGPVNQRAMNSAMEDYLE